MANGRLAQSRVGVLGSGEVGRRLAAGFCSRGHDVVIGSRDPGKPELREWLAGDGAGVKGGTFGQAAAHGELLALAVLGNAAEEAIADAGPETFSGKVVIDAMNPLDFSGGFPPRLSITGQDSLGERVQRALPDAKVVKAFNTIGNPYFVDPGFSEGQPTMLIAGDDESAKRTVGDVLADFGWSDVVDIGGIEGSRELEAICIVWVKIGGARGAWDHGFKLLAGCLSAIRAVGGKIRPDSPTTRTQPVPASGAGWTLAVAVWVHGERVPGARQRRNEDMPQANADEEVGAWRQPSGTGSTCMAASWAIRIGRARSSRSAERAGSRPTWCVSTTVTRPWCSPARTRSSSIRTRRARRARRKAEQPREPVPAAPTQNNARSCRRPGVERIPVQPVQPRRVPGIRPQRHHPAGGIYKPPEPGTRRWMVRHSRLVVR